MKHTIEWTFMVNAGPAAEWERTGAWGRGEGDEASTPVFVVKKRNGSGDK